MSTCHCLKDVAKLRWLDDINVIVNKSLAPAKPELGVSPVDPIAAANVDEDLDYRIATEPQNKTHWSVSSRSLQSRRHANRGRPLAYRRSFWRFSASSPGARPRSDEPKPARDWVAAVAAEERAKPWWQRISCGLCDGDHSARRGVCANSFPGGRRDGKYLHIQGLVGPIPDRRPEPAPIVFGVRRSHCGLGDGVPLRARLSARLITVFPPSLTARQAMAASSPRGR